MRKDMKDVIIDTGRYGGYSCPKGRQHNKNLEDLPEKEGMRCHHGWGKEQSDRLNPLARFLNSRVGQKWDDVFSEICRQNDRRTLRGHHLREHLEWMVATWNEHNAGRSFWWRRDFYIDESGFLRRGPEGGFKFPQPPEDPDNCMIDGRHYRRINKCWFLIVNADSDDEWKRQLSKKELRDLGLSNFSG